LVQDNLEIGRLPREEETPESNGRHLFKRPLVHGSEPPMRRILILGTVAAAASAIAVGALAIFLYASPTGTNSISSTASLSSESMSQAGAPPSGYQDSAGQPQGMWSDYLGFIPPGYVLAPKLNHGPNFPCPQGMDDAQCKEFQASCGNGVCDPNEACLSCPLDCGPVGQLTCDPYTLRLGSPIGPCQVGPGPGFPGDTGGGGN
jgi:hypothetical protein